MLVCSELQTSMTNTNEQEKKIKTKPHDIKYKEQYTRSPRRTKRPVQKQNSEMQQNEEDYAISEISEYSKTTKIYLKKSRQRIIKKIKKASDRKSNNKKVKTIPSSYSSGERNPTVPVNNYDPGMSLGISKTSAKYKETLIGQTYIKSNQIYNSKIKYKKSFISKIFRVTGKTVKYAYKAINFLIVFIVPILVLLICINIVGMLLAPSPVVKEESLPLSDTVNQYSELVVEICKEYNMEEYAHLVLAVMQQESGGQGNDPMQSSECEYNEEYPNIPNGIEDSEYSIRAGVRYLADCLNLAKVQSSADLDRISLALQGYNYGKGYIEWALKNFGGYSWFNAFCFSEIKKEEMGSSIYGDPDYVNHVLRYY